MRKVFQILFVTLLVFCFGLVGSVDLSSAPAPKDTLVVGTANFGFEATDPIVWEALWTFATHNNLIGTNDKGQPDRRLGIARKWTLSRDGKTWTFYIRKGVKFHNGDPLTAEDVAFSIKHFASPESKNPWSLWIRLAMVSCEATGKYTVVFKANKVEPPLYVPFRWTRILPKKYIEKNGIEYYRKNPIGSGPWIWKEFISRQKVVLERNDQYWGKKAYFKRVVELMIPEESTRIAMLKRGEVDILGGLTFDNIVALRKEGYQTRNVGLPTVATISFVGTWMAKGPTSDIKVRQALSYAINRDEICKTFYKGLAKPGGRWCIEDHAYGWSKSWKADPYDPGKAKALLKEAGYPDKFSTPEVVINAPNTDPTSIELMQILAGYWEAVGVKTKVNVMDSGPWFGMFFVRVQKPTDPAVGGVFPWVFPGVFNNIYHSANMFTSRGIHGTANYPDLDAAYAKFMVERNPRKAERMWTKFMELGNSKYINVGIVIPESLAVVSKKVGKFDKGASQLMIYDMLAGIHPAK